MNKHIFALYYPLDKTYKHTFQINLTDIEIVHRIKRILRLQKGEQCIFFDQQYHLLVELIDEQAKKLIFSVISYEENKQWNTKITFFLPILKKETLVQAVYSLVEAGVSCIQLVHTEKCHRSFGGQREFERLKRIIISAAEQSKNYNFPQLIAPITFQQAIEFCKPENAYLASVNGLSFGTVICSLAELDAYNLMIGPEADLSIKEIQMVDKKGINRVSLTPTILRAETAAFFTAASFRSILK